VKERPGFQSLEDSSYLPYRDVIAQEILEDLEATLQQYFAGIANDLKKLNRQSSRTRGRVRQHARGMIS